jgi:hypothetical protein
LFPELCNSPFYLVLLFHQLMSECVFYAFIISPSFFESSVCLKELFSLISFSSTCSPYHALSDCGILAEWPGHFI